MSLPINKMMEFLRDMGRSEMTVYFERALRELISLRQTHAVDPWQKIPGDGKISSANGCVLVRRHKGYNRAGRKTFSIGIGYYTVSKTWVADNGSTPITHYSEFMEIPE